MAEKKIKDKFEWSTLTGVIKNKYYASQGRVVENFDWIWTHDLWICTPNTLPTKPSSHSVSSMGFWWVGFFFNVGVCLHGSVGRASENQFKGRWFKSQSSRSFRTSTARLCLAYTYLWLKDKHNSWKPIHSL